MEQGCDAACGQLSRQLLTGLLSVLLAWQQQVDISPADACRSGAQPATRPLSAALEQAGFGSLAPSEYMKSPAACSLTGKRRSVHNFVEQGCPRPPALVLAGPAVSEASRHPTRRL